MSIAMFSEINFSLLFPFILSEMHNLDTARVAYVLATMGATDIMFRFAAPYIGEALTLSHRNMYLLSLVLFTFMRSGDSRRYNMVRECIKSITIAPVQAVTIKYPSLMQ